MEDNKFVDGLMVKKPRENTPEFVKGSISLKREELIKWLQNKDTEWINLDILESKKGNWYAKVNDWKPEKKVERPEMDVNYEENSGVPF
jgi:hypothetical protein